MTGDCYEESDRFATEDTASFTVLMLENHDRFLGKQVAIEGIETAVRGDILEHFSPEVGHFLSQRQAALAVSEDGNGSGEPFGLSSGRKLADPSKASWRKLASAKSRRSSSNSKPESNGVLI